MEKEELQNILSEFKEEVVNLIGQQAQQQASVLDRKSVV